VEVHYLALAAAGRVRTTPQQLVVTAVREILTLRAVVVRVVRLVI
jgi:hypothetical protein